MKDSEMETEKCFICYEDEPIPGEENQDFFRPCARNDDNSNCNIWAHQDCLTHWLKQSQNENCSTCGQPYIVVNRPPNIYENAIYLFKSTISLVYQGLYTFYLIVKSSIRNYKNNFQSNVLQSNFLFSRCINQIMRTLRLVPGIMQMNFGLLRDEMTLMDITACFFLGVNLYGYLTFSVNLSDNILVEYLTKDIQIPDLYNNDNQIIPPNRRDRIKKLEDMKKLQEQKSYQIYRYIIKSNLIQCLFPIASPKSINFYCILEAMINLTCSYFIGYIYFHYIQSFWFCKYFWNLKIFGQSYYLIGLFIRSIILPPIIYYFNILKLQIISWIHLINRSNSNSYFDWMSLKLKLFPNINPKYPYHNFDDKYPELENKHPIPPPNNFYRPCYNCRQKVDLVVIPDSNPNISAPIYCPNEKCDQIAYIPNTPIHQNKYIIASCVDLTYDITLLYFYAKVLLLEQVSFYSKFILILGIYGIISDTILEPMKSSRKNIICYLNFLNQNEIERDYPEEEENPAGPIKYRHLMKHFNICCNIFGGIFEFYLNQLIDYLSICPRYIWFVFTKCVIHQICIQYIYPFIYSYLYEQSPKDFMESELFSYTFSSTLALLYGIITCIIFPCITYIQKRTTTNYIENPLLIQNKED